MTRAANPDWLWAETLAWPLVSRAAFDQCIVRLARTDPATGRLADALDHWLRPRASGWSLDALARLRKRCWFPGQCAQATLTEYVTRIAGELLVIRNGRVELIELDDEREAYKIAVNRWHWLSRAVPPDLLVAARASELPHDVDGPTAERVHLSSRALDELLGRKVAETHLHVGAAVPFPVLWTGLMAHVGDPAFLDPDARTKRVDQPPFGTAERLVGKLAAASAIRALLAGHLQHQADTGDRATFSERWPAHAVSLARAACWHAGESGFVRSLRRLVHTGVMADVDLDIPTARALVRALSAGRGQGQGQEGSGVGAVAEQDPLSCWLPAAEEKALPETRFARRALTYLRARHGSGSSDDDFARLFWQYQRIRGQCFRHLVHEPGTQGLDWFERHFQRISWLRKPVEEHKFAIALQSQRQGLHLSSLEVRTSPESSWDGNDQLVRDLARQGLRSQRCPDRPAHEPLDCELALVLHFVKRSRCACGRAHGDPRHVSTGGRYSAWLQEARVQVRAVARLLRYRPEALFLLRGVDVANLEASIPTWVTAPVIAEARAASAACASRLGQHSPGPFRVTCHAGEDYLHLLSGMRRMHELFDAGILKEGDRIGHGLAAGADIDTFIRTRGLVFERAEERLDDLLWVLCVLDRCRDRDLRQVRERGAAIRSQARRIAGQIYGSDRRLTIDALIAARRLRHDGRARAALGYPGRDAGPPPRADAARHLLWRYLFDAGVYERGQHVLEVRTTYASDKTALRALQGWLRAQLVERRITVESNPTSNLGIADMATLEEHPSFVLQPLDRRRRSVRLSINTDNPLTFSTCLADEYTYLHAAFLRPGQDTSQALAWLERARVCGVESRFSTPASAHPGVLRHVITHTDAGPDPDRSGISTAGRS